MNADAAKVTDADRPWTTPGADALDRRTTAAWIQETKGSPLGKVAFDAMMTGDNGVRTEWQSYLANLASVKGGGLAKYWTDSEVYRCKGGNQQLARRLAAAVGEKRVLLGSPVEAIDVKDRLVSVRLSSGRVLEAEDVIVTTPPSVWNKIAFDPPLPATLAPQMGTNVKCLIGLQGPFWRREELAPDLLSDGPINWTWNGTDGQPGAGAALVAFSGGPDADTCRAWPAALRVENYLKELSKVYKGVRASFVRGQFMDWPSDIWVACVVLVPRTRPGDDVRPDAVECHWPRAIRRRAHELCLPRLHGRRPSLRRDGRTQPRRARRCREEGGVRALPGIACLLVTLSCAADREADRRDVAAEIDVALTPPGPGDGAQPRDGIAAVLLIDVSGSMDDEIRGEGRKIVLARRAALDLVKQFDAYADAHPSEPVLVGLFEFSGPGESREVRSAVGARRG